EEFRELRDSIDIMDQQVLPRFRAARGDRERLESTIGTFRKLLDMIRFRMNELFAGITLRDEGLDIETQLPDRQYLPAILARTMQSHLESGRPCCLLLVEIGLPDVVDHHRAGLRARLMHGRVSCTPQLTCCPIACAPPTMCSALRTSSSWSSPSKHRCWPPDSCRH
ncbi:MAG: hypothetical protein MUF55_01160, partial [Hydrogenophaga sp.]|nr:hypothetical protein [Hydrogenophaga sp.]